MSVLIQLLVYAIVFGLIWYVLTLLPLPAPFAKIAQIVMVLIFIVLLLGLVLGSPLPTLRLGG